MMLITHTSESHFRRNIVAYGSGGSVCEKVHLGMYVSKIVGPCAYVCVYKDVFCVCMCVCVYEGVCEWRSYLGRGPAR